MRLTHSAQFKVIVATIVDPVQQETSIGDEAGVLFDGQMRWLES